MTFIHDPGGVGFRIESLYAFLAVHADGDEGLVGLNNLPMIAADKALLDQVKLRMEELAKVSPKPIVLVQFTHRIDLETLGGPE